MEIRITGDAKEIAALVLEIQERREELQEFNLPSFGFSSDPDLDLVTIE